MKETKITKQFLADSVGVSRPIISEYCSQKKKPSIDHFILIADYFDVTMDYLAGRDKP